MRKMVVGRVQISRLIKMNYLSSHVNDGEITTGRSSGRVLGGVGFTDPSHSCASRSFGKVIMRVVDKHSQVHM